MHAREPGINVKSIERGPLIFHRAEKDQDLSVLNILGIGQFIDEKHHVYVTLSYDIRNSRVIHIEEGKESDVFGKFITKHSFMEPSGIDHITMDIYP